MAAATQPVQDRIVVCRDGHEVTEATADLFRMPDGRQGCRYGGLVFPLSSDRRIEVTDVGAPPAHCTRWVEPAALWYFLPDTDDLDEYIFVDGARQDCDRACEALRRAGLGISRIGPNLSGLPGDWFIRITSSGPRSRELIVEVLGNTVAPVDAVGARDLRMRLLAEALAAATVSQNDLRRQLEDISTEATAAVSEARALPILRSNLEALAARLAEAETELEQLRRRGTVVPTAIRPTTRLETELSIVAAALLPRLDFIGGSFRFMAVELRDRSSIWRILAELERQLRGQPRNWKLLAGHTGWWERHFPTGGDNQGRVYAKLSADERRWQVLVSHKQGQAADLRRLA